MAKVKVWNRNKFDIGIQLINPIREQNIRAGSFTIVDEDDVYYLNTICDLFKRGMLTVENEEVIENLGLIDVKPIVKTDEEITLILKGNFLKMKKELSEIKEPHMVDAIYRVARSVIDELSGGKLKFLRDFCGKEFYLDEN